MKNSKSWLTHEQKKKFYLKKLIKRAKQNNLNK